MPRASSRDRVSSPGIEAERFVITAVRAFATGTACPPPPRDEGWATLATNAGVLAAVATAVEAAGHDVPAQVRAERFSAAATSMRVSLELRSLGAALADIRWVVLKGPLLADVVYRTTSSRTYDDLDLLVHPRQIGPALDALEAAGCELVTRNWPKIAGMQRGEINLVGRTGTAIDLHWHPVNDAPARTRLPVDVDLMMRHAVDLPVGGSTVPSLGPADLVVYVALHASLSGGHRLRWLLDLQQAVLWSGCPPDDIAWRARTHGLGLIVQTMLDRVVLHLDPSLVGYADAVSSGSPWADVCRWVSRREPPLPGRIGRQHTGRSVFAATRRTGASSARQLLTNLTNDARDRARHRDASAEVAALLSRHDSAADRSAWIAAAAGYRP